MSPPTLPLISPLVKSVNALLGKGKLRKHLSKLGPLLISSPLEVKLKMTAGSFSPTVIGDTSQCGRHDKILAMTFFAMVIEDGGTILFHI